MSHLSIQPPGVVPLYGHGRKPVFRVVGGDTWRVTANLYDPADPSKPADPNETIAKVVLSETQFDAPLWIGEWHKGIRPDAVRKDLFHIEVPLSLTKALRRGSYEFSVVVSDLLGSVSMTELQGSFLVEYSTAGDNHSIPYKDGTWSESSVASGTSGQSVQPVTPSGGGVPQGGSTGQVLVKTTAADYETSWHTITTDDVSGMPPVKVDTDNFLTIV